MMVLMFLCWATVAHALVSKDAEHPNNPDPGTCSVFPIAGVLTNPSLTFVLVLQNHLGTTQTFQVRAFIGGTVLRALNVTLGVDRFAILQPVDIPILTGELADIYVCWPVGSPATGSVPPGALLLLVYQGQLVVEPPTV